MPVRSHATGNELGKETKNLSGDGDAGKIKCSRIVTPGCRKNGTNESRFSPSLDDESF